jgi:hypothetical protein
MQSILQHVAGAYKIYTSTASSTYAFQQKKIKVNGITP